MISVSLFPPVQPILHTGPSTILNKKEKSVHGIFLLEMSRGLPGILNKIDSATWSPLLPAPATSSPVSPCLPLSPYSLATLPGQRQTLPSSPGPCPCPFFSSCKAFPVSHCGHEVHSHPCAQMKPSRLSLAIPCLDLALMTHDTCHSLQLPCLLIRLPVFLILLRENVSTKSGLSLFLFRAAV